MTDYLQQSAAAEKQAREIIAASNIINIWEVAGARVNIVGSLKIGVLAKHRDIDFHIYTPELDIDRSFKIMAAICRPPQIKQCTFINLADTEERCFEWHLQWQTAGNPCWQLDLIQIEAGSLYDGYFEKTADKIKQAMTEEMRQTILELKFATPDDMKIGGIEYYKAVIQDGIRDFESFLRWRQKQNFSGIIPW